MNISIKWMQVDIYLFVNSKLYVAIPIAYPIILINVGIIVPVNFKPFSCHPNQSEREGILWKYYTEYCEKLASKKLIPAQPTLKLNLY